MTPVSTRPTGTVPIPPILYTSYACTRAVSHHAAPSGGVKISLAQDPTPVIPNRSTLCPGLRGRESTVCQAGDARGRRALNGAERSAGRQPGGAGAEACRRASLGGSMRSRASSSVGPLYQDRLLERSIMLSPWKPEMGTKLTCTACATSPDLASHGDGSF